MANITLESLKRLFPRSISLKVTGNIEKVFSGISDYLENCRIFAKNIQKESIPLSSVQLIDDWMVALGLSTPVGATTEEKQRLAGVFLSARGGQSLNYLNSIIQSIFPSIYIEESAPSPPYPQYFYVRGTFDFSRDFDLLKSIIQKTCPLHLEPFYFVRPTEDATLGICGIGSCGEAITGKREIKKRRK